MSQRDELFGFEGKRIEIGLSSIIGVTVVAGQAAAILKYFSGGSLEIGGLSLTWGQGYIMDTKEVVSFQTSGTFFLAATGATVTCMMFRGKTSGFE